MRSAGRTRKTSQDRPLPQPWAVAEERSPTPPSLRRGKQNRSTSPGIRLILASRRSWATGTQSRAWPSSLLPSSRRSRWPSSKRQNLRASRCSSSTGACNPQAPRPPAALVHWCTRACTRALVRSCARALGARPHRYQVAPQSQEAQPAPVPSAGGLTSSSSGTLSSTSCSCTRRMEAPTGHSTPSAEKRASAAQGTAGALLGTPTPHGHPGS